MAEYLIEGLVPRSRLNLDGPAWGSEKALPGRLRSSWKADVVGEAVAEACEYSDNEGRLVANEGRGGASSSGVELSPFSIIALRDPAIVS